MVAGKKVITVRVTTEQYAALREEATRRAVQSGGIADASAILRELIALWMQGLKQKRRK
jgi:hypothetical protein